MVSQLLFGPEDTAIEILQSLGSIGKWLQAIGIIAVVWIIMQIINFSLNQKRVRRLNHLERKIDNIENKLDKLMKKR